MCIGFYCYLHRLLGIFSKRCNLIWVFHLHNYTLTCKLVLKTFSKEKKSSVSLFDARFSPFPYIVSELFLGTFYSALSITECIIVQAGLVEVEDPKLDNERIKIILLPRKVHHERQGCSTSWGEMWQYCLWRMSRIYLRPICFQKRVWYTGWLIPSLGGALLEYSYRQGSEWQ